MRSSPSCARAWPPKAEEGHEAIGLQLLEDAQRLLRRLAVPAEEVLVKLAEGQMQRQIELAPRLGGDAVRVACGRFAAQCR
jgi:nucleotide-binding universal stress UspA family protein